MSEPTVEEALARARQAQEDRIDAIRSLANSRKALAYARDDAEARLAVLKSDLDATIKAAEKDDRRSYQAAVRAGWSDAELKKIGYHAPDRNQQPRKRRAKTAGEPRTQIPTESDSSTTEATLPSPSTTPM